MKFRQIPGVRLAAIATLLAPIAGAAQTFPTDSVVQRLVEERVRDGRAAGIVVGLLDRDGSTRVFTAGTAGAGRTLDRNSLFEIGSITKAFTGVLLADMVRAGEVSLSDPVSKYLPANVNMPSRGGIEITLEHLSSQTSGLPRLPGNMRPANLLNPYADYTVARMVAGHDPAGDTVPLWDLPTLAGAGALRSSMADMLKFAEAMVRPVPALREAVTMATRSRASTGPNMEIGLGWFRQAIGNDTIVWHNGGTGGFRTYVGFMPSAGRAVVVLTNSSGAGSDDLGRHLLIPSLPLVRPQVGTRSDR